MSPQAGQIRKFNSIIKMFCQNYRELDQQSYMDYKVEERKRNLLIWGIRGFDQELGSLDQNCRERPARVRAEVGLQELANRTLADTSNFL